VPSAPFVVPPLLLIVTLVVSAVAKIRDPRDTSSVFLQLGLPRVLLRLRVPRLLPYGELVLAAFLLLASGAWYAVATTATLLLFVGYFLVILRAVRLPYPVSCSCFGRLGLGEVTGWTLARNGALLALALVTWVASWRGEEVAQRLGDLGGWARALVAVAVVAAALAFVARARTRTTRPGAEGDQTAYRPAPAPHGLLHGPDGPVPVRDLTVVAARFLVFGDPERDPVLVSRASGWAARLAPVRLHVVAEQHSATADEQGDLVLVDPGGVFRSRLGAASPGAVVLGTDRMLAGGPVAGEHEIESLFEAVAAELGVAGSPP
jgi:hypothetical protein